MTDPAEPRADGVRPADVQAADAQASDTMHQGMALMDDPRPEAASEALACFDRALAIREALPLETSPLLRFGVAACWLNRADALMRLNGAPQIAEAIRSCDEGIRALRTLPLGDDPRFPRRLALAHHNRALFLQAQGRPVADTVADFDEALAVLQSEDAAAIEDLPYLLCVVWTNLAHALAVEGSAEAAVRACEAAWHAIALVSESEAEAPGAAEVGLKARHALCRAFAQRLSAAQAAGTPMLGDDVHDATDAVDEGLALVRRWEQRGVAAFRSTAVDLFRFGLQLYLIYQPQFLQEFLDENLDPASSSDGYANDPDIVAASKEVVELHGKLYA
jgi:tetratricopeptide (TPR) repeat protein